MSVVIGVHYIVQYIVSVYYYQWKQTINHNDIKPHDDLRESCRIKNADNQKRRCQDPARRDAENEQRHTQHAQPKVLERESIQRAMAREHPGAINYKSIQRATARLDPERREEDNKQQHTRLEQPGVLEY